MVSTGTRRSFRREALALLFAAATIGARLPFLLSHKIAFDSDEAVEGLMARHVLHGEFPAFFWGQAFKGVPEVYAAAGAFALFGSSVTILKSVTLALFASYVALNFVLLDKIAGRWLAVAASMCLILCPPALVFWSLDASAEYVVLMLLGTLLLLLCYQPTPLKSSRVAAIGLVVGLGLWVHQLFIVYLLPLAIVAAPPAREWMKPEMRRARAMPLMLAAAAALYAVLAAIAFVTGGFSLPLGSLSVGVHAPQKLLRIGLAFGTVAALLHIWLNASRAELRVVYARGRPFAVGFVAGYAPAIVYTLFVGIPHSPLRNATLSQLTYAARDIFGNVMLIILGFTMATTERLKIPLAAAVPGLAALGAYLSAQAIGFRRDLSTGFFGLFVILVPLIFIFSGAYLDTQSYRYLIPWYAGLSVAWAAGSLRLARGRTWVAAIVVGSILTVHLWQQILWYRRLNPDVKSAATLECLRSHGIRGGFADYWTSYTLTFLSQEAIVVAPTSGVDRYPRYTELVNALPPEARMANVAECGK